MHEQENTILITGGASGIGQAVTGAVLAEGWNAVVADIDPDSLSRCQETFEDTDGLYCQQLNITDEQAVDALVDRFEASRTPLTGVFNAAGIGRDVPALETDIGMFCEILEVNLIGSFIVARAAAKRMIHRRSGSIVNVASVSGMLGNAGRTAYGASKAAILNMTQVLSIEWAGSGVRVNSIAPGAIETPLVRELHTQEVRHAWNRLVPQGRYGTPDEITGAAMFLLDESKSGYITGQTLAIDGGFTIGRLLPVS